MSMRKFEVDHKLEYVVEVDETIWTYETLQEFGEYFCMEDYDHDDLMMELVEWVIQGVTEGEMLSDIEGLPTIKGILIYDTLNEVSAKFLKEKSR